MNTDKLIPYHSLGPFILGEKIALLKERLICSKLDLRIQFIPTNQNQIGNCKDYFVFQKKQLLAKLCCSQENEIIFIESMNNQKQLLFKKLNLFAKTSDELKEIGKKQKSRIQYYDMGFKWENTGIAFFFEENRWDAFPETISIYTKEYENLELNAIKKVESSLSFKEKMLFKADSFFSPISEKIKNRKRLSPKRNTSRKYQLIPRKSIGSFFLNEELHLLKKRLESTDFKIELLETKSLNQCYDALLSLKEELIANILFSPSKKVIYIEVLDKEQLFYEKIDLFAKPYIELKKIGLSNNSSIKNTELGFQWIELGIIFYFENNVKYAYPESIAIYGEEYDSVLNEYYKTFE
jgi:hypothetical protein